MASAVGSEYEAAKRGLARAIRVHREDCPPLETARVLLSYDAVPNRLVGVTDGVTRAVFIDQAGSCVIGAGFDSTGPVHKRGVVIADFESRAAQRDWLGGRPDGYWEWVHPRYAESTDQ